jgi:phosphoenolpyruvate carboxylase
MLVMGKVMARFMGRVHVSVWIGGDCDGGPMVHMTVRVRVLVMMMVIVMVMVMVMVMVRVMVRVG